MRDAIYAGLLLLSAGTTYGIMSTRVSALESAQAQITTRYEREVVPRQEHLQMNAVLEQRLQAIIDSQQQLDHQITSIQSKLDQLTMKQR